MTLDQDRTPRAPAQRRSLGPFGSVAGGSALGQIALVASLPLIARLYSPAEVGLFALLLTNGQVAAIVLTGRQEQILPRLPMERRWVTARAVLASGTALSPAAAVVLLFPGGRGGWTEFGMATLLVASLCVLSLATFVLLSVQQYTRVALLRTGNGVATALAQVIGGLIYPDAWVLVTTYAVGNVVAAAIALPTLVRLRHTGGSEPFRAIAREEQMGRFAASVGTGSVFSNLALALPLIGISLLFGDAAAGSFYLARRLLMVPAQLVATSVSEVSYGIVARETPERIAALVYAWLRKFRIIAVVLLGVGLGTAPLVPSIVGSGYRDIEWVVVLLTVPAVAQMVATSFSNVLLALHMEVVRTGWNVSRMLGLFGLYWWADASEAILLHVVAAFALYTVLAYAVLLGLTLRGVSSRRVKA